MCSIQIRRYFDNEDNTSFGSKEFNKSPLDLYPSFSYCFEDKEGGLYDKRKFTEFTGLTRIDYKRILTGERQLQDNVSDSNLQNIFDLFI